MIVLKDVIEEIDILAPLPPAAAKLARIAHDWEADVHEVVTIIRYDQALTANILRYANSPMGRSRYRIIHVRDAVVRLGIPKVLEIAVTAHVRGQMLQPLPEYGYSEEDLWRHSVASAVAADILVRRATRKVPALTFTAALLHDIGKLVLARHLEPAVLKTIDYLIGHLDTTYSDAEQQVLGFSHATVGARIAEQWNLGAEIVTAIAAHHNCGADDGLVTDTVRVCNLAAKTVGCGLGLEGMNLFGDAGACERLGITREDFESLCADIRGLLPEIEALYV